MTSDPPFRSELVIMIDANNEITDDPAKAVRGEIDATLPDGSHEHTLFVVPRRSTMLERWADDEAQHAEHYRAEHARRPSGCLPCVVARLLRRLLQAAR